MPKHANINSLGRQILEPPNNNSFAGEQTFHSEHNSLAPLRVRVRVRGKSQTFLMIQKQTDPESSSG